ncbi:hypothetical protein [Agarilytica rhodophyticola]|uniref:hypothetical protein n=1 Tax=Agarilytica rhodophyticola TaxID=1737490 RepID=UPI000B349BC7|nr:hypothetical protein [Agarilytica rhodophyticola]
MYQTGATLQLDYGTYCHYGIADGKGSVIHNSKKHGRVVRESYIHFAEGKDILISHIKGEVVSRAAIAAEKYCGLADDLFLPNSEHFARVCHGLERESIQIQIALQPQKETRVQVKTQVYFSEKLNSLISSLKTLRSGEKNLRFY